MTIETAIEKAKKTTDKETENTMTEEIAEIGPDNEEDPEINIVEIKRMKLKSTNKLLIMLMITISFFHTKSPCRLKYRCHPFLAKDAEDNAQGLLSDITEGTRTTMKESFGTPSRGCQESTTPPTCHLQPSSIPKR